eukprot:5973334-Prymnesium_polylepis.1
MMTLLSAAAVVAATAFWRMAYGGARGRCRALRAPCGASGTRWPMMRPGAVSGAERALRCEAGTRYVSMRERTVPTHTCYRSRTMQHIVLAGNS